MYNANISASKSFSKKDKTKEREQKDNVLLQTATPNLSAICQFEDIKHKQISGQNSKGQFYKTLLISSYIF